MSSGAAQPPFRIRISSTTVLIPVTVTDGSHRCVTGLGREDFRLFEDKVPREISYFAGADSPISVGLVFDSSSSMGSKLGRSRQAVAAFLRTLTPEDEVFLVQFSDHARLAADLTGRPEEIQNRLLSVQPKGRTALVDAVYLAAEEAKRVRNSRKALLILSDGGENTSRYRERQLRRLLRETDAPVYAINVADPLSRERSIEELTGPGLLAEMAEQTGGRYVAVDNLNDLPRIAATVGAELRSQYILGYTPTNRAADGKYRRVRVELAETGPGRKLRVSWRHGYYHTPAR